MAERRNESMIEWLDIQLDTLSPEDKTKLITEILDTLPAGNLRQIRDIAEEKRQGKLEDTKQLVIDKMRSELEQAGIDPDAINVSFGRRRRSKTGYALKAGQLTYDCRYSTMHGMSVTGGRGLEA
jgi:hypothetical protein